MPVRSPEALLTDWQALGMPFESRPRLLAELHGGRTNRSFLIAADDARWVLRLDSPHGAALGIDRIREQRILNVAAAAGLAPALVCADAARGFMLTAYAEGVHLDAASLTDLTLQRLLELMQTVSRLQVDVEPMDYRRHAAHYLARDGAGARIYADLERRIGVLERGHARGLCHHDPAPGNVIFTAQGPLLIDWEYAGRGYPVLDFAALACEWQLDLARLGELSGTDRAVLAEACAVYQDLCRLWDLPAR